MRKDFGRVVIERARSGSACPNLKMRKTGSLRLDGADWNDWDYDGPLKIRTNGIYGVKHAFDRKLREKSFTDVLGPVSGYLRKSVGRLWDDVHSEVSAALGGGGHAIRHVLVSHLLREVQTHTYVENGKVYGQPYERSYGDYFVDPRDGTLREENPPRYRYVPPVLDRHHWKDGLWFVWIDGVWYLGSYTKNQLLASIPSRPQAKNSRSAFGYRLTVSRKSDAEETRDRLWPNVSVNGDTWYFVKWKQAGKKELKELRKMVKV